MHEQAELSCRTKMADLQRKEEAWSQACKATCERTLSASSTCMKALATVSHSWQGFLEEHASTLDAMARHAELAVAEAKVGAESAAAALKVRPRSQRRNASSYADLLSQDARNI